MGAGAFPLWLPLPSPPPEHSPVPEGLPKCSPRPLTAPFPAPGHNAEACRMVQLLLEASWTLPSFLVESLPFQEGPWLSQVRTQLHSVRCAAAAVLPLMCLALDFSTAKSNGEASRTRAPPQPGPVTSPCPRGISSCSPFLPPLVPQERSESGEADHGLVHGGPEQGRRAPSCSSLLPPWDRPALLPGVTPKATRSPHLRLRFLHFPAQI